VRVVIESPYNPSKEQIDVRLRQLCPRMQTERIEYYTAQARTQLLRENILYCRLLYKKALEEGHAPFASHLNYTQVWSEEPGFRERGISAGLAWKAASDEVWYGADLRWSESLKKTHRDELKSFRTIRLFPDWTESQVRAHLAGLPFEAFVGVT